MGDAARRGRLIMASGLSALLANAAPLRPSPSPASVSASERSFDEVDAPTSYVHPGQLHVGTAPEVLATILGSCVTVCLYDPQTRIGGINHFLLPQEVFEGEQVLRYGPTATRELIARVLRAGACARSLTARIVGGSNVLAAFQRDPDHLGLRNAKAAREMLERANIPIVGEDIGGARGRKLVFSLASGHAWVRPT